MKERELLYNNGNLARAEILEILRTKANSIKIGVNIDNPYAEKWDFGDINYITIKKSDNDIFITKYGEPRNGIKIFVSLKIYHKSGNTGFSWKIEYGRRK